MQPKTVLITGAATRIGAALALSFAQAGWDVAVHFNRSKKPAEALEGRIARLKRKAHLVQADLSHEKHAAGVIPSLAKRGVKLDCLINSAAVFTKDSLTTLSAKSWAAHMDVNLLAPLLLMQSFALQYKGNAGNIINISDGIRGWSVGPNFLSYSLSKLGLESATQLLAKELAPNIRVNAIAPGPTLEGPQDKPDTFKKLAKLAPLGRVSSPEEVASAVHAILAMPSFTGQVISLAGGIEL